jgi:hypothetical protein
MTLTPSNEVISVKSSGKKTLSAKVKKLTNLMGMSRERCKDRFLSKSIGLLRVGDEYVLCLIPKLHLLSVSLYQGDKFLI